ncbi:MAG: HAMP domain-containing histidine kinase [Treponema sp.]|nr:HAMP domain-containing histidine kinase [Treponema sp.]
MKIRSQLVQLIIFMVFIPFACMLIFPVYQYISSPQRHLLKGYKEIRALGNIDFTDKDWSVLEQQIKTIPPNVQALVYYNSMVLISTMPEIKAGREMSPSDILELINTTSNMYDYQIQSPERGHPQKAFSSSIRHPPKYLVLSRMKMLDHRKHNFKDLYTVAFLTLLIFESICIAVLINLSRTIASSITLLEHSTMKIANGEIYNAIETPKKRYNSNEITSLTKNLEKIRITIKDDQERRSKFLMGVSHDLRTPIALIKGYTEAITDGVIGDKDSISKSLSIIHSKADQLETMINDLINYVKLNNTEWKQSLEYISLYPILKEFADSSVNTATIYNRNITAEINIDPEFKISMDKNLFNRAMENLFSNALRYTNDNDSISIKAKEESDRITLSIADTGIGIAEKDFENIYEIFYRGTNSRRESGMGIGLSVVKTIIDVHDWKIDVKSKLNEGTEFIITIPK